MIGTFQSSHDNPASRYPFSHWKQWVRGNNLFLNLSGGIRLPRQLRPVGLTSQKEGESSEISFHSHLCSRHGICWFIKAERGFPGGSVVKSPPANAGDVGLIPGSERSPEEGNGTHSSILVWKSHGQRNLVGYKSIGSRRVRYNLAPKQQQKLRDRRETKQRTTAMTKGVRQMVNHHLRD